MIILTASFFSFSVKSHQLKKNLAEVNQVQGVYIFVDSKPSMEYEYLGTVEMKGSWGSGQYQDVRDKLLKKLKAKFSQAEGAIFNFHDGGTDKVDAIKFK